MFIVLNHILVATFLYHRNPSRFLTDKKCGWRSESKKRSCNCDGDGIDENSRSKQASYNKAKNYDDLNKQVCVCYNHVCENSSTATAVASSGQPSKCGLSDRGNAILSLCADLNDQEAALLQVKVIHYLKEQIQAECGFLLLLLHDTQELLCQVIGDKVLEEELRFHSDTDVFAKLRNHHTPVSHTDLDETSVQELESFLCRKVRSFLCVPVFTRQQGQPIALMCIVNKALPSEDFTESDTKTIQECFRYTATVLTSALAVQNERRLKNETQALLQVARNLFQHLGECLQASFVLYPHYMTDRVHLLYVPLRGLSSFTKLSRAHDFIERMKNRHCPVNLCVACCDSQTENCKMNHKTNALASVGHSTQVTDPKVTGGLCIGNVASRVHNKYPGLQGSNPDTSHIGQTMTQSQNKGMSHMHEHIKSPECNTEHVNSECERLRDSVRWPWEGDNTDVQTGGVSSTPVQQTQSKVLPRGKSEGVEKKQRPLVICSNEESSLDTMQIMKPGLASLTSTTPYQSCVESDDSSFLDAWPEIWPNLHISESGNLLAETQSTVPGDEWPHLGHEHNNGPVDGESDWRMCWSEPVLGNLTCSSSSTLSFNDSRQFETSSHNFSPRLTASTPYMSVSNLCESGMLSQSSNMCMVKVDDFDSGSSMTMLSAPIATSCSFVSISNSDYAELTWMKTETDDITPESRRCKAEHTAQLYWTNDLTMLLSEIIQEARNLTQAERCSVFLIDNETDELIAKVFDGVTKENNQVQMEIRIPITQGIAGHVATTGELLNIKDAYSHPLFYRGIDESTGFRTRNILCFPIKDEKDIVIGVAQLCNKKTSSHFTQFDEEIASAFSVYCCISIVHSLMYKKVIDAQSRNKLANELMMYHMKTVLYQKLQEANNRNKLTFEMMLYHMKVTNEDVNAFAQQDHPTPLQIDPEYALFTYSPRALPESETLTAIVSMAEELGFLSRWRIRRDVFSRFILMAKKGYRHPPYHNWMHAYAVTHFCYLLIHNLQLSNCLQEIEVFALFVACICHDIDHRGTNNSFQVASQSVLAALYSSEGSVLERHHFAQTMCILHTEGCNIFENLSCKDYQQVLDLMRDVILATDMAHHLRVLKNIETMAENGFDKTDNRHRKLLLCILMTSCDLSDQTKPWNNTKKIAALIYQEFFSQGDMEKSLGKSPIEMMDRERAEIPDLQISFLDYIAIPVYRVLSKLFPLVVPVLAVVESNKRQWERISEVMKQRNAPLTLDEMLALEDDEIDGILASNDDDNASISAAAS